MFDVLNKVLSAKPIQYHFEEPALYQPKFIIYKIMIVCKKKVVQEKCVRVNKKCCLVLKNPKIDKKIL